MGAFRPPSICAHVSHAALATAGGTKSERLYSLTFHEVCEDCKSRPGEEPTPEPSSRNGRRGKEVAAGEFAGRGVPRSRISPALSHSRRTGSEINGQIGLLGKVQRG